jgi:hypothetical protein
MASTAGEVHLRDEAAAEGGGCDEAARDSSTATAELVEVDVEAEGDADAAGWRPGAGGGGASEQAAVLRRFAFTSEALRSSVVVAFRHVPGTYVYVKGAPEVLADLCEAATLPPNLAEEVSYHTRNGRRVLGCAYKTCGPAGAAWALEASRADVERNLVWGGLLVMENTLKPDSEQAINELTAAGLHCSKCRPSRVKRDAWLAPRRLGPWRKADATQAAQSRLSMRLRVNGAKTRTFPTGGCGTDGVDVAAMVTGDHALTAISVARRCGIMAPRRPVLLCRVVGEDGGGKGGREEEDEDDGALQECDAGKLVFTMVEPLRDEDGAREGGGEAASAMSCGTDRAQARGERKERVKGRRSELRLAEAYELMAGPEEDERGSGGEEEVVEVAMTGAALDILLRLSSTLDPADAQAAGEGSGRLGDRGSSRGEGDGSCLSRLLSGIGCWSTAKAVESGAHTGRKRRTWGPPGLARNRRDLGRAGGIARGLPTNSPPTTPRLLPAAAAPPTPPSLTPTEAHSLPELGPKTHAEMARETICRARVFARCSPVHKQELVAALALEIPATVAFCGDGANDCGALKAAHVGLSLSDAGARALQPYL